MPKKIGYIVRLLLISLISFRQFTAIHEGIIKTVRFENNPRFNNYIICDNRFTTDAEWFMLQNENGEAQNTWVNIVFETDLKPPETETKGLSFHNSNKYYFYVTKKTYNEDSATAPKLTYRVKDWDIIYPVDREWENRLLFESTLFLTYNDYYAAANYNTYIFAFIAYCLLLHFIFKVLKKCIYKISGSLDDK